MKSDLPLVSIWCMTYNHRNYLKDAIESFLRQETDFEYEIIIHDDASTDEPLLVPTGHFHHDSFLARRQTNGAA